MAKQLRLANEQSWPDKPFESDQAYFRRRSLEEDRAAEQAVCKQAQVAHLELAARYSLLAAAIEEASRQVG